MTQTIRPIPAIGRARSEPRERPRRGPSARRLMWMRGRALLEARADRSTPLGRRRPYRDRLVRLALGPVTTGLRLAGLYARGRRNALDVQLRSLDLRIAGLPPAFDGYRILHLTDPHFDMMDGLGDAIAGAVAGVEADLCVLTGDYRADDGGPYTQILAPLARVAEAVDAEDGVFATLGNHDCHAMAGAFERLGVRVLANETVRIRRGEETLSLTGLDDVHRFYTPMAELALREAGPFGPGHIGVALVHSPEMAEEAAGQDYSLYLCGHTHGGQVCLPGGRPIFTNVVRNRRFAAGIWRTGAMTGYASPGAGVSALPVRYNSRGEVTLVTLRPGSRP